MCSEEAIEQRMRAIDLIVLDIDGVMTDGVIAIDDAGVETKHFHVRDGAGIALWRKAGKRVAIVSGRKARVVEVRAAELGITPVVQGASRKLEPFQKIVLELGLETDQVAFMGDDLADLGPMNAAGLAACPSDAAPEVRALAHIVTHAQGGHGAVRELIEAILKAQGSWNEMWHSLASV